MNAKEKFDQLTDAVEKYVYTEGAPEIRKIAELLARRYAVGVRELNNSFVFLTGRSLYDYIRERKMMAAYKLLITAPLFNVEKAIDVSGYDNQSSFSKEFRKRFDLTPKEAFLRKDESLEIPPLNWERISDEAEPKGDDTAATVSADAGCFDTDTVFGIDSDLYARIMEAAELSEFYSLDKVKSNAAFGIATKFDVSLKAAFGFVRDFCDYYSTSCDGSDNIGDNMFTVMIAGKEKLMYAYFNVARSIGEADDLVREAEVSGVDIEEIDPDYLRVYCDGSLNMDLRHFAAYADLFDSLGGDDFEFYISWVDDGVSPEIAAKDGSDDALDILETLPYEEEFYSRGYLEWEEELDGDAVAEPIDVEYDEDNPYYDDNDEYGI